MAQLKGVGIGAGYFSQFHYDAWSRIEAIELAAICDIDAKAANDACQKYEVNNSYTDARQMLDKEKPDFVDIITRPDTHLELVTEAAERGIAIICQKPLAPTLEAARRIVQCASEAKVPLMIHENFRFQPWHREIKKLIDTRAIGDRLHTLTFRSRTGDGWQDDAYMSRQPYFRAMPRFLIYEMGVHFIDTFRFLGGEIEGVFAKLRKLNSAIAGEDTAIVMFEFASSACGLWDANRYNECTDSDPRYTFGEFLIEGSGGSVRLYLDGRITVQRLGQHEQEHPYCHRRRGFAGDCVHATQCHFVDSLRSGETFETNGDDYLRTLQVQEAVYESSSLGKPIRGLIGVTKP